MKNNEPTAEAAARCLELRKFSKRGGRLSRQEMAFCEKMYRQYQEWYERCEVEVFNDTMPFGSNIRRESD